MNQKQCFHFSHCRPFTVMSCDGTLYWTTGIRSMVYLYSAMDTMLRGCLHKIIRRIYALVEMVSTSTIVVIPLPRNTVVIYMAGLLRPFGYQIVLLILLHSIKTTSYLNRFQDEPVQLPPQRVISIQNRNWEILEEEKSTITYTNPSTA